MPRDSSTPLFINPMDYNNVNQYESLSLAADKVNYTVPTGFELCITQWSVAFIHPAPFIIELQVDGIVISSIGGGNSNDSSIITFPPQSPHGPFASGSLLKLHLSQGPQGKEWAGGFIGYLVPV